MSPERDGFAALRERLEQRFAEGVKSAWSDSEFNECALAVFDFQYEANAAYRGLARGRGLRAGELSSWREVPAVPTRAFKRLSLVSGEEDDVERIFRTSGTTGGQGERGSHHVRSLALYRAAALPTLRAHLLPEGGRIRILSLVPPADLQPESSLAAMVGFALESFGAAGSAYFTDPDQGQDHRGFDEAVARAVSDREPVLVVGTAFAFVHWLDAAGPNARGSVLPEGSRVMETGGFKGRSREVARTDLYRALAARLGIDAARIVNEYGMTELLSQFYEPVLHEGGETGRRLVGPPWVRTRVLDPETLEESPEGTVGLLCHLDLANVGSVAAVLTEDLGKRVGDGFVLSGRSAGAEPRGCSLVMEEIMRATTR